ncbi:MAG TPA: DUF58 domain-containing protein [Gaiellaceae bacterium]|nr:DUF58 domain-containing protein [Gaiellaceae bacterium]
MSPSATPKLAGYAGLAAAGLLASLILSRPELVALTAPFLIALGVGLGLVTTPRVSVHATLDDERLLEGEETTARVVLEAASPVDRVDVYLQLPPDVELIEGTNPVSLRLAAGERRELELHVRAARWGGHLLGPAYARASDPFGLLRWEAVAATRPQLRAYPREDVLRRIVQPAQTQVFAGNELARHKGEGIEFADIRQWTPGDPVKRVNWRASARRAGELVVNETHPDRNTDVILFVDSFAEARHAGEGTLDLAVRATAALADAYVRRRDRVGLIGFGGILRWLLPGGGTVQLYRIVDALIDTEVVLSYYFKEIDIIPRRSLPPNALVVALTPLLDQRSVGALLDLRSRGYDVSAIDVSPLPYTPRPARGSDAVAYDLWVLRRDALRHRLHSAGIAVAEWKAGDPLQLPLEEVSAFRRHARLARA